MKKFLRYASYFSIFIIIVVFGTIIGAYIYFSSSLPSYEGQVNLAGIQHKTTITRDKHAIPHITAKTKQDAYFAVGYAHAQDRLWQMQLHRHIAQGRLSELVGERGVSTDKFLRNLGMFHAAKNAYSLLSAATKSKLEAYSAGVNAFLAQDNVLPIEFALLRLDKPANWQPIDSVSWMKVMAWDLNSTWRKELDRLLLSTNLSLKKTADIHPPYPGDKIFTPPNPNDLYGFALNPIKVSHAPKRPTQSLVTQIIDNQTIDGIGSNNWVIAGSLTKSGKPILANDPHLALTAPALWYHVHIKTEDNSLNAMGSTMPGVPFIILGRTDKIAWGFTNSDPDVQDLFVEKITKPGFYKTPTGEAAFNTRKEIIKVKGQEDVVISVRSTRHGPVISDYLPDAAALLGQNHVLAMQWTALDDDSKTLDAAAGLAESQNWDEFKSHLKHFKAPQQSIVYADIEGNIGFYAPGAVPIRHPDNELYGQFPAPGWIAKYDWQSYIPFEELPQLFNPPKGYIATANHKFIASDYKHYIASKWTLPYRYNRISELIEKSKNHTVQSSINIQLDQYSKFLETFRPIINQSLKSTALVNKQSKDAYALIKQWDGRATVNSTEMLILSLWIRNLQIALLAPDIDDPRKINHQFLINVLTNKNQMASWCSNLSSSKMVASPNKVNGQNCGRVVSATLAETLAQLQDQLGDDMQKWRWGDVHQSTSKHRLFDKVAILNKIFNIVTPIGGGKTTVNVATYGATDAKDLNIIFKNTHGPSLRHIFDFSNLENSKYIHSSGQSGNIFSNYYEDYNPIWAKGSYLPMSMQKANYLPASIGSLILIPK